MEVNDVLTFGSLFAGIGGFDLGFERAGMTCKWQVEIDPYCQKVLAKHWPNARRHDDVRTFPPEPIKQWRVDVICGGFPCQDISYAGKGAGLSGERSGLFYEAMRVVGILGPGIVVLENVAALLTRGLDQVLGTLASFGFDAEWHCIPAAAVGAPHIRDRLFLLAYSKSIGCNWENKNDGRDWGDKSPTRLANRCSEIPDTESNRRGQRWSRGIAGISARKENATSLADSICMRQLQPQGSEQDQRGWIGDGSWWITEPDVGRVAHGVPFGLELLGGKVNAEGDHSEANTEAHIAGRKVLRMLWEQRELAKASPHILGNRLRDIVPNLPCPSGLARWVAKAESDKGLRDLWESFYSEPFKEQCHLQQELLERARQEERIQTVEFKGQRVNRLRGLGNAVVPQVAEFIGRRIMEATKCS